MSEVFVSVGSNVDRERNVSLALNRIEARFGRLRLSSVYESEPVGFEGAPFFNLVAGFESEESPGEIVAAMRAIEEKSGRTRDEHRYGPRTLDLDLLLYGEMICDINGIVLPRDEIARYAFVLRPLAEIAPGLRHPVKGKTIAELWSEFDDSSQPTRVVSPRLDHAPDPREGSGRSVGRMASK